MRRLLDLFRPRFRIKSLPGLALWLDASDAASVTNVDGRVRQWRDKSGRDNHASQSEATLRPRLTESAIGGCAAISFGEDGGTHQLIVPDAPDFKGGELALFVVFRRRNDAANVERVLGKYSSEGDRREWMLTLHPAERLHFASSSDGIREDGLGMLAAKAAAGAPCLLDLFLKQPYGKPDTVFVRVNNDKASQTRGPAPGLFNGASPLFIGAREAKPIFPFAGEIGEIIICRKALPAALRLRVLDYLAEKWGFQAPA